MEIRLLCLTAFIVSIGLASVQPRDEIGYDPHGVRENFRNFFNSLDENDREKTDTYRKVLDEEAIREKQFLQRRRMGHIAPFLTMNHAWTLAEAFQRRSELPKSAFDGMKETWRVRQRKNANEHWKLGHKSGEIHGKAATFKREAEMSDNSSDISVADYEEADADTFADTDSKVQNQTEAPHWDRIYVFRSSNNDDLEQVAQQVNASRSQFERTLIRLEKLGSKVNAAADTYKVCYRKYGYNLDESMYYVDRFNEHLNDTCDTVRLVLDNRPNEISQSELNTAINGADLELRKQAFDGLSPNYQLPESLLCCGIELELLRKVLEGNAEYASAESRSEAGKKARLEMLRKAQKFRQEEETRRMNDTAGSTVTNVCTTDPSVDDFV